MNCKVLGAVAYLAVGFLTFAFIIDGPRTERELKYGDTSDRSFAAVFSIPGWPIYWGGVGALIAVRAIKSAKVCP